MKVLVVDNDVQRLGRTVALMGKNFPDCTVQAEHDALMAGKYVFNNPVDMVFAAWDMKRMSGPELAAFIRKHHPAAQVILTSCPQERAGGKPRNGEADALLGEPLKDEDLLAVMSDQGRVE